MPANNCHRHLKKNRHYTDCYLYCIFICVCILGFSMYNTTRSQKIRKKHRYQKKRGCVLCRGSHAALSEKSHNVSVTSLCSQILRSFAFIIPWVLLLNLVHDEATDFQVTK